LVPEKSSRPVRALSRERIVKLAIARADARGLEYVSMRKLAAELSVTPMALYWHFTNRDALLDAMTEEVAGALVYDDDPGAPWQARLREVLTAALTVFRAHPWLGPLVSRRIVTRPNYLRALEVLLDAVRTAGYKRQAAADVVDFAIDSVAAIAAGLKGGPTAKRPAPSRGQLEMRQQILDLAGADYPRIHEAAVPLTSAKAPGAYAKLGIEILVRGIESAAPKSKRR
jgi:TetR/AcrR family transcriptional regulator, tetracycline repressor protein